MDNPIFSTLTRLEAHTLFLSCQVNALFRALPSEVAQEALVQLSSEVEVLKKAFQRAGSEQELIEAIDFHHQNWGYAQNHD